MERLHELLLAELALGCEPMPGARELLRRAGRARRSAGAVLELAARDRRRGAARRTARRRRSPRRSPATTATRRSRRPTPISPRRARSAPTPRAASRSRTRRPARSRRAPAGMHVIGVPSVPGVSLDGVCDELHESLAEPALWALARAGARSGRRRVGGHRARVAAAEEPVGDAADRDRQPVGEQPVGERRDDRVAGRRRRRSPACRSGRPRRSRGRPA